MESESAYFFFSTVHLKTIQIHFLICYIGFKEKFRAHGEGMIWMKIKAHIDDMFQQIEIHICNMEMNQQVTDLLEDLNRIFGGQLIGIDANGNKCVLSQGSISRFYAEGQKVFAKNEEGSYIILKKLYELEQELDDSVFIRISKSEIINMRKIKRLDMNTIGTIKVMMRDGTETYTSRRNVTRLKQALEKGIMRKEER